MSISEAYNSWAEIYDTNKNRTRDLDLVATKKALSNMSFDSILELGCGTGKNSLWLSELCKKLVAFDFSEEMLLKAKEKVNRDHVEFHTRDIILDWNLGEQKFDLVTCNLVLEHIDKMDAIFDKAFNVLRRGGYFFVCELHPFKQYLGSKARYESNGELKELEVFLHHLSDYLRDASEAGFKLKEMNEWFDEDNRNEIPRLISILFKKD